MLLHVLVIVLMIFGVRYTGLDKKIRMHLSPLVAPPPLEEFKPEPVRRTPPPRAPKIERPPEIAAVPTPPVIQPVERAPEPVVQPAPPAVKTNVFTSPVQAVQRTAQQVHTGSFAEAKADAPRQNAAMLRQNVFPGQDSDASARPAGQVKASGFGAPATLVKPVAGMPSEVAMGNFFNGVAGGPPGRTQGGGGNVSVGGFGNGSSTGVPGGNGNGNGGGSAGGRVATGGFGNAAVAAQPVARAQRPAEAPVSPVEILSKPSPSYTEEARRLKVEGVVLIQVLFLATGDLRILNVVRSLGHGLDQNAMEAVRKIRFRAARQEGRPIDSVAEVEIRFQLAFQGD